MDLRDFFGSLSHEWLDKFLRLRIGDIRTAIQLASTEVVARKTYVCTSWIKHNGEYSFLHADGAINAKGNDSSICVNLDIRLQGIKLVLPPPDQIRNAVQQVFKLLNMAPSKICFILLASVFRSIFGECKPIDFTIFLVGLLIVSQFAEH
jgi:hypothetical protein